MTLNFKNKFEEKSWNYYINDLKTKFEMPDILNRADLIIDFENMIIVIEFSYTCVFEYDNMIKKKQKICGKYNQNYTNLNFVHGIYVNKNDEKVEKQKAIDFLVENMKRINLTIGMFADKEMLEYLLDYDFDIGFQYNSRVDLSVLAEDIRKALIKKNDQKFSELFKEACQKGLGYDEKCNSIYITLSFLNNKQYMIVADNIYYEHQNENFGESKTLYIWKDKKYIQWRKDISHNMLCKKVRNNNDIECLYEKYEVDPSYKKMFKMLIYLSRYHLENFSSFETFFVKNRDLQIKDISYSENKNNPLDRFIENKSFDPNLLDIISENIKDNKSIEKLGYIINNKYKWSFQEEKEMDDLFKLVESLTLGGRLHQFIYFGDDVKFFYEGQSLKLFPGLHSVLLFKTNRYLTIRSYYNIFKSIFISKDKVIEKLKQDHHFNDNDIKNFFTDDLNEESKSILRKNIPLFYAQYYSAEEYEKIFHVTPPNQNEINEILNPDHEAKHFSQLYIEYIERHTYYFLPEEMKQKYFSAQIPESLDYIEWNDEFFMKQINKDGLEFYQPYIKPKKSKFKRLYTDDGLFEFQGRPKINRMSAVVPQQE